MKCFSLRLFCLCILFLSTRLDAALAESPISVKGTTSVTVEEAKKLYDLGIPFVDVRDPFKYSHQRIKGALSLQFKNGFSEASLLKLLGDKNSPFIPYCDGIHCGLSAVAAQQAVAWGFKHVYYFRAGIPAWKTRGYPLEGTVVKQQSRAR